MDILKIARILDYKGAYKLADKLDKFAQQIPNNYSGPVYTAAQYYDNPTTPKEIMDIRRKLIPTDFRAEIAKAENKPYFNNNLLHTNDPQSFVNSLFKFGKSKNITNLTQAFDAFADAGATYEGASIKDNDQLFDLYMMIRETPRMFSPNELVSYLSSNLNK